MLLLSYITTGASGFSNNLPPWDDPAIVTAANASKHFNNNNNSPLRSNQEGRGNQDEQPHWMKSLQVGYASPDDKLFFILSCWSSVLFMGLVWQSLTVV